MSNTFFKIIMGIIYSFVIFIFFGSSLLSSTVFLLLSSFKILPYSLFGFSLLTASSYIFKYWIFLIYLRVFLSLVILWEVLLLLSVLEHSFHLFLEVHVSWFLILGWNIFNRHVCFLNFFFNYFISQFGSVSSYF